MTRLEFLRPTGLGDQAAEVGDTLDVEGVSRVRELIATGRAKLAPEEAPLPEPTALTTETFAPQEPMPHEETTTKTKRGHK